MKVQALVGLLLSLSWVWLGSSGSSLFSRHLGLCEFFGATGREGSVVLVKTESTPPWVPTNRFALSLEEIGYGHQQLTRMKTGTVGLLPELDKRNQQSSAVLVVQRVSAVVALLSL